MTAPDDGAGRVGTAPMLASQSIDGSSDDQTRTSSSVIHQFPTTPTEQASASKRNAIRVFDPDDPLPIAECFINDKYRHQKLRTLSLFCGQFFAWHGTHYALVEEQTIRAQLYQFLKAAKRLTPADKLVPFCPTPHKVSKVLDALRALVHIPASSISLPTWLGPDRDSQLNPIEILACANGLLHLSTSQLLPSTPAFFSTNALSFPYDPDAPEPKIWLSFLNELWPGDPESVSVLQEVFGYFLVSDTRQQKMFLLLGPKRSGKGTIGRVLRGLLGENSICAPTLASLSTNFGLQALIGKQLAIVSDARLSKRADGQIIAERLLSISGEDALTIDRKYLQAWTGQLACRILILTNELFEISDPSGAFASRFIILKLTESFYGREDTTLTDRLLLELPGILNWSIDGWRRLQDRGNFLQPQTAVGTAQQLDNLGNPVGAFVQDYCIVGPDQAIQVDQLHKMWVAYCAQYGYDRPSDVQTFGRDLAAAVPGIKAKQRRKDGGRTRYWIGIGER